MVELEARVAALEAETWAQDHAAAVEGRQCQATADAAVQAAMDLDQETREELPPLVRNLAAASVGTTGRYTVSHLVVPTILRPPRYASIQAGMVRAVRRI